MPPLSVLHAKYFLGEVVCTEFVFNDDNEIDLYYRIGESIVNALGNRIACQIQAVFIKNMGAITWGSTSREAVDNALVLEEDAFRTWQARIALNQMYDYMPYELSKKYYFENSRHIPLDQNIDKVSMDKLEFLWESNGEERR